MNRLLLAALFVSIVGCTTNGGSDVDRGAADAAFDHDDSSVGHMDSGELGDADASDGGDASDARNAGDAGDARAADCRPIPTDTHDAAAGVCPTDGGLNGVLVHQPCSDTCAECPTVGVFGPCICNGTEWGCASDEACGSDFSLRFWYGGLPPATCP